MLTLKGLATRSERQNFLDNYWQQKPLLLREALPGFIDPISADELAGLATMDEVESRLVSHANDANTIDIEYGPFSEQRLRQMASRDSTLLVQSVDFHDPSVANLKQAFDFIPAWRLDDVMVSFASPGGGVGPHFDYYDVFLIQGQGQRLWRLGQQCDGSTPVIDCHGLQILRHFEPGVEYLLEAGDILYVPPGLAHWGSAVSNSLTYSIGFRAPAIDECALEWAAQLSERNLAEHRYRDVAPYRLAENLDNENEPPQARASSELSAASVKRLQLLLTEKLDELGSVASVLGRLQTERSTLDEESDQAIGLMDTRRLQASVAAEQVWLRAASARCCYFCDNNEVSVFFNGQQFSLPLSQRTWVETLCENTELTAATIDHFCPQMNEPDKLINAELLIAMINAGFWQLLPDPKQAV